MKCRHCEQTLEHVFLDLGFAPHSNAYLSKEELSKPELYFPLRLYVCAHCFLVQTEDFACADELFKSDYAYFSSVSVSWLKHAEQYADMIIRRLNLDSNSFVVEIASNDGYLLKNFINKNIPCLGIEPTDGTADAAEKLKISVIREFFDHTIAKKLSIEGKQADLIIANNVYAHVPDINNFTRALKELLKPDGTITLEFPHLMQLIKQTQFDTVYHEHFSYLSLTTVAQIFLQAQLRIFDVEKLSTHGGSLRIYGCHIENTRSSSPVVERLIKQEQENGLHDIQSYLQFQYQADEVKNQLLSFLLEQKRLGKTVVAYGAAAKGNTLLNYAGVKPDLISMVYDAAPSKQGKYLPGSHIPIHSPSMMSEAKPDYVLILPWNISDEVFKQNQNLYQQGTQFVVAVPELRYIQEPNRT